VAIARCIPALCGKLVERGARVEIAKQLESMLLQHHTKVYIKGARLQITPTMLSTYLLLGGFGVHTLNIGSPLRGLGLIKPMHKPSISDALVRQQVMDVGSAAWASRVARTYNMKDANAARLRMVEANLAKSWPRECVNSWYEVIGDYMRRTRIYRGIREVTVSDTQMGAYLQRVKTLTRHVLLEGNPLTPGWFSEIEGCWTMIDPPELTAFRTFCSDAVVNGMSVTACFHHLLRNQPLIPVPTHLAAVERQLGITGTLAVICGEVHFNEVCSPVIHEDLRAVIRALTLSSVELHTVKTVNQIVNYVEVGEHMLGKFITNML